MSAFLTFVIVLFTGSAQTGMEQHLRDAIVLNTERRARYASVTEGRSDGLFRRLILSEQALLPLARLIDASAAPFVGEGIPVVQADFVPMDRVAPFGTPVPPTRAMSEDDMVAVRALLRRVYRDSGGGLEATVQTCAEALEELRLIEREAELSFSMCRHLIESLGYAALHGLEHNRASDGETARLVSVLVGLQRLGLVTLDPVGIDQQANVFHQQGLGIIANEMPLIPFEEELGR
jgi:hypothetical protein